MNRFKESTLSDTSSEDECDNGERNHRPKANVAAKSFYSATRKRKRSSDDDSSAEEEPVKTLQPMERLVNNSSKKVVMSSVAQKMMQSMGYKEGTGLGKHNQGRVEIVEASNQRGRRGLGLHLKGLEPSHEIDWQKEEITAVESIEWMPECTEDPPILTDMRQWMREGPKKLTVDDETEFCSDQIVRKVVSCKSVFDILEPEEMRRARTRSNPFETIGRAIFQNRAAVKMANIDSLFDFMFTKPISETGDSTVGPNDLLYFADICAGPGGFSEYVLWRKGWEAKGFGFTLKGPNDFKLEEFLAGSPESFEPHYGVNGIDGDGNIYSSDNLREFRRFVLSNTDNKGVHFVMADGGFSVEGQENLQEILSKQLYLCQFLCALYILRPGGHFVCKLFDLFTPFSVGLVYLAYRAFRKVCIVKPNTSRPANSERYIICKWKREGTRDVEDYLFEVNCRIEQLKNRESIGVNEIVSIDMLKEDIKFYNYIVLSNETLGQIQCLHLAKIQAFCQNADLHEERQGDLRKKCLEIWEVPDKVRSAPPRPDPHNKFLELITGDTPDYMTYLAQPLDVKALEAIKSVYDYRCVVSGVERNNKTDRGFILGLGRGHVFRWDTSSGNRWLKLQLTVEIPSDTLVYAEIVYELRGEGKGQRKMACLHIIDALVLGGKDVRAKHFTERIAEAQKLTKAISKLSRPDYTPVRVKQVYRFEEMQRIFDRLEHRIFKGGGGGRRLCYCTDEEKYFLPHGIILFRTIRDPWTMAFSRSAKTKYFFNLRTRASHFQIPKDAVASFKDCFASRLMWAWESGVKIHDEQNDANEDKVHRESILQKINQLS